MIIGDEEKTMIFFLHFYKVNKSTKVIAKVHISGWTDSTYNCFHSAKVQLFE
jgi:hypothetical protein